MEDFGDYDEDILADENIDRFDNVDGLFFFLWALYIDTS